MTSQITGKALRLRNSKTWAPEVGSCQQSKELSHAVLGELRHGSGQQECLP